MKQVLLASITLAVTVPGAASAKSVTRGHDREYERAYQRVARELGPRAPGRNIVRNGTARGAANDAQVTSSIRVLARMVAPVSPGASVPASSTNTAEPAAAAPMPSTSSSLPSCTWAPESGGNPSAVNPQSGAAGYYQIMPGTWAAYGGSGSPQSAPMSEQTAVAQRIWNSQGPSAWANC